MYCKAAETVTGFGNVALLVVFHGVQEDVKEADQVCGTGLVLWVELNTGRGGEHITTNLTKTC